MANNSEEYRKRKREWYQNNKHSVLVKQKRYYEENTELLKQRTREYKKNNRDKVRESNRLYAANRRLDIEYKLACNLRSRISSVIKKKCNVRSSLVIEILGCSLSEFKLYIESQFKENMNWDNYGVNGWHIDHITPISSAKNKEDFIKLNHYTNLQPLLADENRKKGGKENGF